MKKITQSASKIVFIVIALTTCVTFFTGRLSEANFMLLAGSAFTFYFTNKNETVVRKPEEIISTEIIG